MWIFLAWQDPETQAFQKLIHSFYKNADWVLLKIRLQTPTKTILEDVLFMYVNNIYKHCWDLIFYDPKCCWHAEYGHWVSKVWWKWLEENNMFFATLYYTVIKTQNKCLKNIYTIFLLDQTRVSIFLTTVLIRFIQI